MIESLRNNQSFKNGDHMKKIIQTIIATVIAMLTLFTPIRVFASDDTSDNLYEYIDSQGKTHTFFDVSGNQLSIYEVEELMKEKTEKSAMQHLSQQMLNKR
jgi:hypothetical protein